MKKLGLALALALTLSVWAQARGGMWSKAVSGIGRAGDPQTAERYAIEQLDKEILAHEDLCRSQSGAVEVKRAWRPACRQYPLNWQCDAGATVICRFP